MNMRIISAKDHGDSFRTLESGRAVKDFADLAGKNVVVTSGTTSGMLLNKLNDEKK
ncbi:hypothetical protein [Enterococcus faecium]|uniref:hypothetical protein n=1 Tax=Enterococcus faecium TaxID=1352 RepID=UPI0027B98D39|nr:hypothetical protein [Enterococcus faecium]